MSMGLFTSQTRAGAEALSRLSYANPFLPERIACEREVLGGDFVPATAVWSVRADRDVHNPTVERLAARALTVATAARERLASRAEATADELRLYEDVVLYLLYARTENRFYELIVPHGDAGPAPAAVRELYAAFERDAEHFLGVAGGPPGVRQELPHIFACFFQVRRAFHHIFSVIVGASMPAARLRAAVWQSIFSHDMRRYRRTLYRHMDDITTLVTGPSGTGKELVARAIGLSRYIPFDPRARAFAGDFTSGFHALNLSALSPTLIESELFGHRRGAFTGALEDRAGWLEACGPASTVFLDEIGELDAAIQVKLLRVLQSRTFQRLGDTKTRRFQGKIVAATNRDLVAEMRAGRFRPDFYYRLCADTIVTPTLAEQLAASPDELGNLIRFLAARIAGRDETEGLAREVEAWIARHLGRDYPWPGNVRELEQCVRNVLIRREYRPPPPAPASAREDLAQAVCAGGLTADELLRRYCTLVFADTGSYQATARRLGLDRRTVRARVDRTLAAAYGRSPVDTPPPPAGRSAAKRRRT